MSEKYSTLSVRERAVRAVLNGHTVTGVAATYDVHRITLHRWLARYEEVYREVLAQRRPS